MYSYTYNLLSYILSLIDYFLFYLIETFKHRYIFWTSHITSNIMNLFCKYFIWILLTSNEKRRVIICSAVDLFVCMFTDCWVNKCGSILKIFFSFQRVLTGCVIHTTEVVPQSPSQDIMRGFHGYWGSLNKYSNFDDLFIYFSVYCKRIFKNCVIFEDIQPHANI